MNATFEFAQAIVRVFLELLRTIAKSLRYIFCGGRAKERQRKLHAELDQLDADREREIMKTRSILREANRLDTEREKKATRKAEALRQKQLHTDWCDITAIGLLPGATAVRMHIADIFGLFHQCCMQIDEEGQVFMDESTPVTLLDAMAKTGDAPGALAKLMDKIQPEVDRQMQARGEAAEWRRHCQNNIVEIISSSN